MSAEEEVELRDLVSQTLELNGCLPKIRAQLRANLFLALDEDSKISKQQPLLNTKVKSYLQSPEGQLMFCLVREFLEYFDLDFTASVYEPESYIGSFYKYEGRDKIIEDLGLKSVEDNISGPVLFQVVKIAQMKSKTLKINLTNLNGSEQNESKGTNSSSTHDKMNGHSSDVNGSFHKKSSESENVKKASDPSNNVKENDVLDSTYVKKNADDDTFNGTSSIEEDEAANNGVDNSGNTSQRSTVSEESVSSAEQESSPESKSKSEDKTKSKSDKLKSKLELPPLQLNKPRGSGLLPSLYHKEFKEKTNKDYEFEIRDNYEEEFMSGGELEFSQNKDSPKPLFEELQQCSENTSSPTSAVSQNKNLANKTKSQNSRSDNNVNSNSSENIETNLSIDEGSTNSEGHTEENT